MACFISPPPRSAVGHTVTGHHARVLCGFGTPHQDLAALLEALRWPADPQPLSTPDVRRRRPGRLTVQRPGVAQCLSASNGRVDDDRAPVGGGALARTAAALLLSLEDRRRVQGAVRIRHGAGAERATTH